jgi:hypothetical protein
MNTAHWHNNFDRGQTEVLGEKPYPSATSPTVDLTLNDPQSNPDIRGDKRRLTARATARYTLCHNPADHKAHYHSLENFKYYEGALKLRFKPTECFIEKEAQLWMVTSKKWWLK